MVTVSSELLQAIWAALNAEVPKARIYSARTLLVKIADDGWMFNHQLEDLCYDADARLLPHSHGVDIEKLAEALGYRWVSVCDRPKMRSLGVIAYDAMSSADAAGFLLDLEKLGFAIDPGLLVQRLRPDIAKKRRVINSELDIFWAPKLRGKSTLALQSDEDWRYSKIARGKFANGYRYEAWVDADGDIYSLTVKGPKYRHRRDPVKEVCPDCGHKWWRGDPDSSASHRKEHRKRMYVLAPQPVPALTAARMSEAEPDLVTASSPAWKHFEMYQRARAFKREEGYDFVQWHSSESETDPHVHGFLLCDDHDTILGAIAFRWREPENDPPFWGLQWVWVCPTARKSGVLSRRWAAFRERFGDFYVEGPVSKGMRAFLTKHGDTDLMRWPSRRGSSSADDVTAEDVDSI